MKKILSLFIIFTMLLGASSIVLADDQTSRDAFDKVYMDNMATIVDLRAQTQSEVNGNNVISAKIKDKLNAATVSQTNSEAIVKIKAVIAQNKDLETQARAIYAQKKTLKAQWEKSVKAKDTISMNALETQILSLTTQIESLRTQILANIATVKPLEDQVKAYSNATKALRAKVQPLINQVKKDHDKIAEEEKTKNGYWTKFSADVKSKNYSGAANDLQSIISAKTQIIADIKSRGNDLNNTLKAIGQ
jgi:chromosome segregation ATPase